LELLAALPLLARFVNNRCAADRCLATKAVMGLAAAMPFCGVSSFASCEQAATWAAAAEAVLRLLPLLEAGQSVASLEEAGHQHQQPEQQPEQGQVQGAGALLEQSVSNLLIYMIHFMWDKTSKAVYDWAGSEAVQQGDDEQREALSTLARQLWGLHSACCRAAHWLLREPSRQRAPIADDLLQHSTYLLSAALGLQHAAGGVQGAARSDLRWAARSLCFRLCRKHGNAATVAKRPAHAACAEAHSSLAVPYMPAVVSHLAPCLPRMRAPSPRCSPASMAAPFRPALFIITSACSTANRSLAHLQATTGSGACTWRLC
jgi:hypothetical protein